MEADRCGKGKQMRPLILLMLSALLVPAASGQSKTAGELLPSCLIAQQAFTAPNGIPVDVGEAEFCIGYIKGVVDALTDTGEIVVVQPFTTKDAVNDFVRVTTALPHRQKEGAPVMVEAALTTSGRAKTVRR
jgi:hypothetical protein